MRNIFYAVITTMALAALSLFPSGPALGAEQAGQSGAKAMEKAASIGESQSAIYGGVKTLVQTAEAMADTDDARGRFIALLRDYMAQNPTVYSVWTVWEPDMFDGRDAEYIDAPYHDGSGRFLPVLARDVAGLRVEAYTGYGDLSGGYAGAVRSRAAYVGEPYYGSNGKAMYTVCAPVLRDGQVVGAVGAEVDISTWQDGLTPYSLPRGSYMFVVSPGGSIAAHPQQRLLLDKAGRELTGETLLQLNRLLEKGGSMDVPVSTSGLGEAMLSARTVEGVGGGYWAVCSVTPAQASSGGITSGALPFIAVGIAVLAAGFLIYMLIRPRKPLGELAGHMDKMAGGSRTPDMDYSGGNKQLQQLCTAFNRLNDLAAEHLGHARTLAAGQFLSETNGKENDEMYKSLLDVSKRMYMLQQRISGLEKNASGSSARLKQGRRTLGTSLEKRQRDIAALAGRIQAMEQQDMRVEGYANEAASQLQALMEKVDELTPRLDTLEKEAAGLRNHCDYMANSMQQLDELAFRARILAINARIEAAHSGRPVFSALADELKDLSEQCDLLAADGIERLSIRPEQDDGQAAQSLNSLVQTVQDMGDTLANISFENSNTLHENTVAVFDNLLQDCRQADTLIGSGVELLNEIPELEQPWWNRN